MPNHGTTQTTSGSDQEFLIGLGRASAGALIFSLPMMMTMEMWWIGFWIDPLRLALLLGLLVPLLVGLSRLGGFRNNLHWLDDVADALVAIVVGGTIAALILWLFGVLTADMPVREIVGKISIQLFPASIGAMLAQNQLGGDPGKQKVERNYVGELFLMAVGAMFLSLNIAPTEEIALISYKMGIWHLIALAAISMALMHLIVYAANFSGTVPRHPAESFFSVFARFSLVGYAVRQFVFAMDFWRARRAWLATRNRNGTRLKPSRCHWRRRSAVDPLTPRKRPASQKAQATSPWEWVTAGVGGAMICAAIGYMVWSGLTTREGLPALELEQVATTRAGTSYLVEVLVRNQGPATAASAQIEGQITGPDGALETSEATVDFVPPNSSRTAFLQFSKDPAGRLELRVKGMAKP